MEFELEEFAFKVERYDAYFIEKMHLNNQVNLENTFGNGDTDIEPNQLINKFK